MNTATFRKIPNVTLAAIPPEAWGLLRFPAYQRKPTSRKVKDIAKGLRDGYQTAPIILYKSDDAFQIVDGGYRFSAYRLNYETYGIAADIPALIYEQDAIDQNQTFVLENNKLRMDTNSMIRADNTRICSKLLRAMGRDKSLEGTPFYGCADLADYPIRPLTIVKAALFLAAQGGDIRGNDLAYLSVIRALDRLEQVIAYEHRNDFWGNVLNPFLRYVFSLWGDSGRHLLNFGVIGFAYFLARNGARFFDSDGKILINTKRRDKSQSCRGRNVEYESKTDSDFAKLAAVKDRWNKLGDDLRIYAPNDPVRVAFAINAHFWYKKQHSERIWTPERDL